MKRNGMHDWWNDELKPVKDDAEWLRLWEEALAWARKEGLIPEIDMSSKSD